MSSTRARRALLLPELALGSAAALFLALTVLAAEPKRPNLQGSWKLNPELTARVNKDQEGGQREESKDTGGKGHHKSGAGDWGGGGTPGDELPVDGKRGGSGTAASADAERDGGKAGAAGQVRQGAALDALTIAQTGDQITITDRHGESLAVKADGSKVRVASAPGGAAQVKTRWDDDGSLLVEVKPDKGPKRTESYLVSNDGKHLYLTVTTGGALSATVTTTLRAYDRAPDPQPAPAPVPEPPAPPPVRQPG
jgi:hypothetical protein